MADAEASGSADSPRWLGWVRALQSIAQAGLTYADDPYDVERYHHVRRIAADIAASASAGDAKTIEGFFASQRGYPTPKIDVRAAVIVQEQILLVRERDDGCWSMPGGWADVGESAAEAVVRETREEAGLEVRAVKLIALYERERRGHPFHPEFSYKAFFACHVRGSTDRAEALETLGAAFFPALELPALSLPRISSQQVDLAFAHHRNPELPTEFD